MHTTITSFFLSSDSLLHSILINITHRCGIFFWNIITLLRVHWIASHSNVIFYGFCSYSHFMLHFAFLAYISFALECLSSIKSRNTKSLLSRIYVNDNNVWTVMLVHHVLSINNNKIRWVQMHSIATLYWTRYWMQMLETIQMI